MRGSAGEDERYFSFLGLSGSSKLRLSARKGAVILQEGVFKRASTTSFSSVNFS